MPETVQSAIAAGKMIVWAAGGLVAKAKRGEAEVFQVYPRGDGVAARADLVFIHGIGGDARYSWSAETGYFWPAHLGEDPVVAGCRILSVDYPTSLHALDDVKALELEERAHNVRDKLRAAGVGDRPFILVCHSMGGLIAKQVLVGLAANRDLEPMWTSLAGVVFFATPHEGSAIADVLRHVKGLVSDEVAQLSEADWGPIDKLHADFMKHVKACRARRDGRTPRLHAFYEQFQATVAIVSKKSATRDMDNGSDGGIPANHETICKPVGPTSASFVNTLALVEEWLGDAQADVPFKSLDAARRLEGDEVPPTLLQGGRTKRRWWALALGALAAVGALGLVGFKLLSPPIPEPHASTPDAGPHDAGTDAPDSPRACVEPHRWQSIGAAGIEWMISTVGERELVACAPSLASDPQLPQVTFDQARTVCEQLGARLPTADDWSSIASLGDLSRTRSCLGTPSPSCSFGPLVASQDEWVVRVESDGRDAVGVVAWSGAAAWRSIPLVFDAAPSVATARCVRESNDDEGGEE